MTLTELIARVERGDGPDRELDAEIAVALRIPHPNGLWSLNFPEWEADITDKGRVWAVGNVNGNGGHRAGSWISDTYTASLDAAMTLVMEGFKWAVTSRNSACCHMQNVTPLDWKFCATPALALTAAALRARMGDEK